MSKLLNFHNKTEYSFLESTITLEKLINHAVNNQMKHLVLTDHNNMFGVPYFLELCKKNGIKPIIGLDLDVENYQLILIAKNYQGFLELSKLSTQKMSNNDIFLENIDPENLIIIDHPNNGYYAKNNKQLEISNYYINSKDENIENAIWVVEHTINHPEEKQYLKILSEISKKNSYNPYFDYKGLDFEEELSEKIIQRTNELANQIDVVFPKQILFPKYVNEDNLSSFDYLKKVLNQAIIDKKEELKKYPQAKERLLYELTVIEKLDFTDYFLIIWDFIKWSKDSGIYIGPGRGSSAGSLVCYLLNITNINPLKYNLYFERFLNPKRISMPDIDIDIQDSRRDEVIDYITKKYGNEYVALITTFQTLGAKAAFRDVARVKNLSLSEVDALSKIIPLNSTLEEAYNSSAKFQAKIESKKEYKEIFEIAKFIEGMPRQHGTHAAGIVVSRQKIYQTIPTMVLSNGKNQTQFTMNYLENFGLIKIDLLGLKNLSSLQQMVDEVNFSLDKNIKVENIPLDNAVTNKLLSSGNTAGVFQLESNGMIAILKRVQVAKLEDLADILSLYRPGPMQMINEYLKNKHNPNNIPFVSKEYNEIISSTHGIIVYQEQIMEICQKIANMDYSDADILRKAISKKSFTDIEPIKKIFLKGAIEKGFSEQFANHVFALIEKFADYGFNKAHAISYATLAYQMAYLKALYPVQFFSSVLNQANGAHEIINKYVFEAKNMNFFIESPDINISELKCVTKISTIYLPLIMIKGLGVSAINKILNERQENGYYKSFANFYARARIAKIGPAAIQLLINSNALRKFGNMQTLNSNLEKIENYAKFITIKENDEEILDFSLLDEPELKEEKINLDLERNQENALLGMIYNNPESYDLSGNQVNFDTMHLNVSYSLDLIIENIRIFKDKRGLDMAHLFLSDNQKTLKITLFASRWNKFVELTKFKLVNFEITKKTENDYYLSDKFKGIITKNA